VNSPVPRQNSIGPVSERWRGFLDASAEGSQRCRRRVSTLNVDHWRDPACDEGKGAAGILCK